MKKIISIIVLLSILSLSVYAGYSTVTTSGDKYKVSIPVVKGWNLLPSDTSWWDLSEQDIVGLQEENILRVFLYLPLHNKYVKTHPGTDPQDMQLITPNMDHLRTAADWYYIDKAGTMVFTIDKNMPRHNLPSNRIKLNQGWNLLAAPPWFMDGSLAWGDCDIQKIYLWEPGKQKWHDWPASPSMTIGEKFLEQVDEMVGVGVAVKSANECELGPAVEPIPSVPSLPN
ncbi:hypothetical protein ACFL6I_21260 [candidate division KSB1 bacterium]